MKREELLEKVQSMVCQISGREECPPELDLMEEAGLSSIEVMELFSALEDVYKVKIPARELRFVATVEDLADLVWGKLER